MQQHNTVFDIQVINVTVWPGHTKLFNIYKICKDMREYLMYIGKLTKPT